MDKSGANLAALEALNAERSTPIKVRQNKYLNNIVEQDHRAIKRIIKPMMGFKDFRCARIIMAGIELMHNVVIVLGNSNSSASPFVIGHGVMRDSIDSAAVLADGAVLASDAPASTGHPEVHPLWFLQPPPSASVP